jgi:hypothetical protein
MPFCPVLPCIVSVFESLVGGEAELGDRNATGRERDLRILSYVFHQDYFVDAFCHVTHAVPSIYEHPLVLPHSMQR